MMVEQRPGTQRAENSHRDPYIEGRDLTGDGGLLKPQSPSPLARLH